MDNSKSGMATALPPAGGVNWFRAWRWPIWSVALAGWTVLLLIPSPVPSLPPNFPWHAVAKVVHVTANAVLVILAGWLGVRARLRCIRIFVIMAQGAVTEMLQTLPALHRDGNVYDVGWDHLGVFLGLLVSWKWWIKKDSTA